MTKKRILSLLLVTAFTITFTSWTLVSAAPTISMLDLSGNEYIDIDKDNIPDVFNGETIKFKGSTTATNVTISIVGPSENYPTSIFYNSYTAAQYEAGVSILISSDTSLIRYGTYTVKIGYAGEFDTVQFDVAGKKQIIAGAYPASEFLSTTPATSIIDGINQRVFAQNSSVGFDTLTVKRGIESLTLPNTVLVDYIDSETNLRTDDTPLAISYTGTPDLTVAGLYTVESNIVLPRGYFMDNTATVNDLNVDVINVSSAVKISNNNAPLTVATDPSTLTALTAAVEGDPADTVKWEITSADSLTKDNVVSSDIDGKYSTKVITLNKDGVIEIIGAGSARVKATSNSNSALIDEITITVSTTLLTIDDPGNYTVKVAADAEEAGTLEADVILNKPATVNATAAVLVGELEHPVISIPVTEWLGVVNYQAVKDYNKVGTLGTLPPYTTNTNNLVPNWKIIVDYKDATEVVIKNSNNEPFNPQDDVNKFMELNSTTTITATVLPVNLANQAVLWNVSGTSATFAEETGIVTGVSAGLTLITATSIANPLQSQTIKVYVLDKIVSFDDLAPKIKHIGDELLSSEYITSITANLASGGEVPIQVTFTPPIFDINIIDTHNLTPIVTMWDPFTTLSGNLYGISTTYTATVPNWPVMYVDRTYPYAVSLVNSIINPVTGDQAIDITVTPSGGDPFDGVKYLVIQSYDSKGAPITVASMSIQAGISNYSTTYSMARSIVQISKYRVAILSQNNTDPTVPLGQTLADAVEIVK